MTDDDMLTSIKEGLRAQVLEAIQVDNIPQVHVQQVTQSWLLLQILEKLTGIDDNINALRDNSDDEWKRKYGE